MAWVAALLLLVLGTAHIASAGADPRTAGGTPATQPVVSGESLKHANVVSGPGVQGIRQTVSAVITPAGVVVPGQSYQALYANRLDAGTYEVFFSQDIAKGTYVATIGVAEIEAANESLPGLITVAPRVNTKNGLWIRTYDPMGKPADRGFHVIVQF